jgi:hypothetical protein
MNCPPKRDAALHRLSREPIGDIKAGAILATSISAAWPATFVSNSASVLQPMIHGIVNYVFCAFAFLICADLVDRHA